ncbi:Hypothetical predicted protein, partial [Prunus dulcis]
HLLQWQSSILCVCFYPLLLTTIGPYCSLMSKMYFYMVTSRKRFTWIFLLVF